ncbi:TMEM175 family protein [Alloscardovia macacae]|uniref:DUF1211 domain-containing protein n=1 Tax=Alloscardovia macacae TaxID=1160091 RepID=A0A261F4U2_9BIFI|nr:TMEM175 family protein [Alloscardovia macacae]OZG54140.1 hypothetical protein ALMA_0601 [Alloscardovia macacae]
MTQNQQNVQNTSPDTDAIIRNHDEFEAMHTSFIHERMNALADGVTAIAMTILVLEIHVPDDTSSAALLALATQIGLFALSFVVVANFYHTRMRLMSLVARSNTPLIFADFVFLLGICLLPLLTKMVFEYPDHRLAVAGFGFVMLLVKGILNAMGSIILKYRLVSSSAMNDVYTSEESTRILHRDARQEVLGTLLVMLIAIAQPAFGVWFYAISPLISFLRRYRVGSAYARRGRVSTIFDEKLERSLLSRRRRR